MHITLIFDYLNKRIPGGPGGVAYDTVEGLKKNHARLEKEDIHVHILSSEGTKFHSDFETDEKYGNISIEYFKRLKPTVFLADLNYFYRIKKQKKTTDLIHSHIINGAVAGTLLQIPTVFTLHGIYWKEKYFTQDFSSRFASESNIIRFRYLSSRLKKIFAISPYVIHELDEFLPGVHRNTKVIENPVSDIFFKLEKQETEGLLVFPGVITSRKNQIGLIQALALLKKDAMKFHCVLPGPVADYGYFNELQGIIKKYGLEGDVTIPGSVPFEHLLGLYSHASIMVLTSLQETAPMVISEAMATGTPVIASQISGIPYMVSTGNSGFLIDPQSPRDVANRVAILLDDKSLRKKYGEESRRIAASRWKSEVIVNNQLNEYRLPE